MTRWPMTLLRYDWPTPISPLTIGTMIIRRTYTLSWPKVLAWQRVVDEQLEQVRVDQPEQAGDDDREQHDRDAAAVRPEEAGDAPDGGRAPLLGYARQFAARRSHHLRRAPASAAATPKSHRVRPIGTERSTCTPWKLGGCRRHSEGPMTRTRTRLLRGCCHRAGRCLRQPCVAHPTASHGTQHTTRRRGHDSAAAAATTPAAAATTPAAATTAGGQATPPPQGGGTIVAN